MRNTVAVSPGATPGMVWIDDQDGGSIVLTRNELRQVVQQAYDLFGILATPSLFTEAGRVTA